MKTLTITLFTLFTIAYLTAQDSMSSQNWQEDLDFLQETVHKDYSFLFKKVEKSEFDEAVKDLRKSIPNLEEHEIIVGFSRIVSMFKYGHTSMGLSGWRDQSKFPMTQMAYNLKWFKDGIYIQGTPKEYEKALGSRVLKIGEVPVEKALQMVKPVFPTENDQFFKAYGMSYLGNAQILHAQGVTSSLQNEISLTLEKDGKEFIQSFKAIEKKSFPGKYTYVIENEEWLDARDNSKDPLYLKNLDKIYYYEYLPENKAVYVRQSQIQDDPGESIPEFYDRVFKFIEDNEVEKLILDVRLNGGGNNYKNKPIVTGVIKSKINKPGHFFVITSGQTFSACQNLVNELDNYTEAVFVGEPTGENVNFYGDVNVVELPNSKLPVRLSFAWWQDKPQWEGDEWLAPHINIEMTYEDYRSNQDPAVNAILNFEGRNFILDPMSYLTDLYMTGQMDKMQSESIRIINDPNYKFFDFESEFNTAGYRVLQSGDANTAITIFEFITMLFPDSPNAWDSLAEGNWKAGNIDKAIELYNKAIKMDPDGLTGNNAREMLKKMKTEK